MEKVSESFSFGGQQLVFSHKSETNDCEMNFAVFLPPNFKNAPVLWYLSGLTRLVYAFVNSCWVSAENFALYTLT